MVIITPGVRKHFKLQSLMFHFQHLSAFALLTAYNCISFALLELAVRDIFNCITAVFNMKHTAFLHQITKLIGDLSCTLCGVFQCVIVTLYWP